MDFNIIKVSSSNVLIGTGTCGSSSNCQNNFCCNTSVCGGVGHPACSALSSSIPFGSNNDYLACSTCSAISSRYNIGPSGGSCNPIDHTDLTKFPTISFTIPASAVRFSNSYGIGYWLFVENQSVFGDNLITIQYGGIMALSFGF
jgi:hypothetical protein